MYSIDPQKTIKSSSIDPQVLTNVLKWPQNHCHHCPHFFLILSSLCHHYVITMSSFSYNFLIILSSISYHYVNFLSLCHQFLIIMSSLCCHFVISILCCRRFVIILSSRTLAAYNLSGWGCLWESVKRANIRSSIVFTRTEQDILFLLSIHSHVTTLLLFVFRLLNK